MLRIACTAWSALGFADLGLQGLEPLLQRSTEAPGFCFISPGCTCSGDIAKLLGRKPYKRRSNTGSLEIGPSIQCIACGAQLLAAQCNHLERLVSNQAGPAMLARYLKGSYIDGLRSKRHFNPCSFSCLCRHRLRKMGNSKIFEHRPAKGQRNKSNQEISFALRKAIAYQGGR